jgi:lipopolysaccharide export LptBFGC system permease protein LptF
MAESNFPNKAIMALSILLIIGGVALYFGWGIAYGSWNMFNRNFIPIYTLVVPMVLFGLLGIYLVRQKK